MLVSKIKSFGLIKILFCCFDVPLVIYPGQTPSPYKTNYNSLLTTLNPILKLAFMPKNRCRECCSHEEIKIRHC